MRAADATPSDRKKRRGLMDGGAPADHGHEAAGVVNEPGEIGELIESGRVR